MVKISLRFSTSHYYYVHLFRSRLTNRLADDHQHHAWTSMQPALSHYCALYISFLRVVFYVLLQVELSDMTPVMAYEWRMISYLCDVKCPVNGLARPSCMPRV